MKIGDNIHSISKTVWVGFIIQNGWQTEEGIDSLGLLESYGDDIHNSVTTDFFVFINWS